VRKRNAYVFRNGVLTASALVAALRELLATGERDVEALERHRVSASRTVAKVR
jgi:hypothetical protein